MNLGRMIGLIGWCSFFLLTDTLVVAAIMEKDRQEELKCAYTTEQCLELTLRSKKKIVDDILVDRTVHPIYYTKKHIPSGMIFIEDRSSEVCDHGDKYLEILDLENGETVYVPFDEIPYSNSAFSYGKRVVDQPVSRHNPVGLFIDMDQIQRKTKEKGVFYGLNIEGFITIRDIGKYAFSFGGDLNEKFVIFTQDRDMVFRKHKKASAKYDPSCWYGQDKSKKKEVMENHQIVRYLEHLFALWNPDPQVECPIIDTHKSLWLQGDSVLLINGNEGGAIQNMATYEGVTYFYAHDQESLERVAEGVRRVDGTAVIFLDSSYERKSAFILERPVHFENQHSVRIFGINRLKEALVSGCKDQLCASYTDMWNFINQDREGVFIRLGKGFFAEQQYDMDVYPLFTFAHATDNVPIFLHNMNVYLAKESLGKHAGYVVFAAAYSEENRDALEDKSIFYYLGFCDRSQQVMLLKRKASEVWMTPFLEKRVPFSIVPSWESYPGKPRKVRVSGGIFSIPIQ